MRKWLRRFGLVSKSLLFTVVIHAVLLSFLVFSFNWIDTAKRGGAKPIQAVAVPARDLEAEQAAKDLEDLIRRQQEEQKKQEDLKHKRAQEAKQKKVEAEKKRKEEEKRKEEAKKKKQEAEKKRKAAEKKKAQEAEKKREAEAKRKEEEEKKEREAEAKRKEEEKKKEHEVEKKRKAEEAKKKREVEKKRKAEEEKKKREAEKKRKAEEAKKKREAEKKRKAEEEKKKREAELRKQLEIEQRVKIQNDAADALSALVDRIAAAVEGNWRRPPAIRAGLIAVIRVTVARDGRVTSARVTRSSGDPFFDQSAELAVRKASPLPFPSNPEYYEFINEFDFKFAPDAL